MSILSEQIFSVTNATFEEIALQVFQFQFNEIEIYKQYCQALNRTPNKVKSLLDIPFLPIEFFKSHSITYSQKQTQQLFESSGTTGAITSKHFVADLALYQTSFTLGFQNFYGNIEEYIVLALLPSYLERNNSSLVYMANDLIAKSKQAESGFFLNNTAALFDLLQHLKSTNKKVILIGVTFALLNFVETYQLYFPNLIVMETGGMKGRREELTRAEIHTILKAGFGVNTIHSEYGMTELLSQAYSKGEGIFKNPAWMKIQTRDMYDPLSLQQAGKTGAINIIDLANIYSCSFIATSDLGRVNTDGSFEIIGRMEQSEMRGCNLLVL